MRANLTQQAGYKKRQMNQRFYLEAYQRAGDRFLAARLECVFKVLETPEDIALHKRHGQRDQCVDDAREVNKTVVYPPGCRCDTDTNGGFYTGWLRAI